MGLPFGEHCSEYCPDMLPFEAQIDPHRAETLRALGEMGVQCPFLCVDDGPAACALPWSLFSQLAAQRGFVPYKQTLDAAHAVVDGALSLDELPPTEVADPAIELLRWQGVLKLAAQRYAEHQA
jgi:hypothetical protein